MAAMLQKNVMLSTALKIVMSAQQSIQPIFQPMIFYAKNVTKIMLSIPKQNNVCYVMELTTISWIAIKFTALLVHPVAKLVLEV